MHVRLICAIKFYLLAYLLKRLPIFKVLSLLNSTENNGDGVHSVLRNSKIIF